MTKAKKRKNESDAVMTVADLAALILENDKSLRALIGGLGAKTDRSISILDEKITSLDTKIEESIADLAASVSRSFSRVGEQLEEFKTQTEDRFQSVEMKILGVSNRIDILIERTPSREEFGRLEGRVAALETRRQR